MEKIIFVYNADGGILNGIKDLIHKNLSPSTYECLLCALTYNNVGMINEWKDFTKTLGIPVEFLHRDELKQQTSLQNIPLPTALIQTKENALQVWISIDEMNRCQSINDLKELVLEKLK